MFNGCTIDCKFRATTNNSTRKYPCCNMHKGHKFNSTKVHSIQLIYLFGTKVSCQHQCIPISHPNTELQTKECFVDQKSNIRFYKFRLSNDDKCLQHTTELKRMIAHLDSTVFTSPKQQRTIFVFLLHAFTVSAQPKSDAHRQWSFCEIAWQPTHKNNNMAGDKNSQSC